jgi:hypothetical protein
MHYNMRWPCGRKVNIMQKKKKSGCLKNFILLVFVLIMAVAVVFAGSAHTSTTHIAAPSQNWVQQLQQYLNSHNPTTSKQHATLTSPSGPCFDQARAAAKAVGIDPLLYARQINQESGCQGRICSLAGACGAAQLMPEMAKSLGVNPMNVAQSLQAGAHLMAGYLKLYHGNWALALACYNAGTGTVKAVLSYGTAWYTHLPFETQHYIASILGQGGQA